MTEKRSHDRSPTLPTGVASLMVDGVTLPVKDISYGGMSIKGIPSGAENTAFTHQGTLLLLGDQTSIRFKVAYYTKNSTGIIFVHDSPTTLLFLRSPLEFIKAGMSITAVSSEVMQDRYKSGKTRVYRGDMQSEIVCAEGANLADASLAVSFRMSDINKRIVLKGKKLSTGTINKPEQLIPATASVDADNQPDHYSVRMATAILVGAVSTTSDHLLESGLAALVERLNKQSVAPDLNKPTITG